MHVPHAIHAAKPSAPVIAQAFPVRPVGDGFSAPRTLPLLDASPNPAGLLLTIHPGLAQAGMQQAGDDWGIERQGVDQGSACLPTRQGGQAGRTLTEAEVTVRRLGGRNLPAGPKARTSEWLRRQGEYTTVAGRSSTGWGFSRSLSGRRACPRQNQAASRRTPGTAIVRRVRRAPPGIAARPRAGIKGLAGPMENTGLLVASRHGPGRKNVPAMTGRVRVNLPSLTD